MTALDGVPGPPRGCGDVSAWQAGYKTALDQAIASRVALHTAQHPTMGMLAIYPIPASSEVALPEASAMFDGPGAEQLQVMAGIVLETGELPPGTPDAVAGWTDGATVFYWKTKAIHLGGFHFLHVSNVVAWSDAPR